MPFSQNDIRALVLIIGSEEPMNPRALQAELGLQRETISRLITHLVEKGLVERRGREVTLAGTPRQRPSRGSTTAIGPHPCRRFSLSRE